FAIAAHLEPDILLIDEVLAVGDERFQLRCFERVGKLLTTGAAGILVTHQLQNIERLCSRCLVVAKGEPLVITEDLGQALAHYRKPGAGETKEPLVFQNPSSPIILDDIYTNSNR